MLGTLLRRILEWPFSVTIIPTDFYLTTPSGGASYGGTIGVTITSHDQYLKQLFKLEEAYISVKYPPLKWIKFFQLEKLQIPIKSAYGPPPRVKMAIAPLHGIGSLEFIVEFKQNLARGQELHAGWRTTLVVPMVGRIRQIEHSFEHTQFL